MKYPMLTPPYVSRDTTDVFGGYNHNIRIGENEFFDMENLCSDSYPLLAVREKRENPALKRISIGGSNFESDTDIKGMCYNDKMYQIRRIGSVMSLCAGNAQKAQWNTNGVNNSAERQIIPMGSKMIILPDKKVINLAESTPTVQNIDNINFAGSDVLFQPCLADGSVLSIDYVGDIVPIAPFDGFVWLDTRVSPSSLKKYYASQTTWQSYLSSYVKISADNTIGEGFNVGDSIKISGITGDDLQSLNNTTIIKEIANDKKSIVVSGMIDPMPDKSVLTAEYTQDSFDGEIWFISNEPVAENALQGRYYIINDELYYCNANTASTPLSYIPYYDHSVMGWDSNRAELRELEVVDTDSETGRIFVNSNELDPTIARDRRIISIGDLSDRNLATVFDIGFVGVSAGTPYDGMNYLYIDRRDVSDIEPGTVLRTISYTQQEGKHRVKLYFTTADPPIISVEVSVQMGDKTCPALDNQYKQIYNDSALVSFSRKMPETDFVIESQNRLWGCRYGPNNDGEFVNEIYCSKLGDPTNWQVYQGISTDSYAASCGTPGEWTGAVNYRGYPTFFKENYIHTVYGSNPPFQIKDVQARGIQKGSSGSLAMVNEVLLYKGIHGICAYTGGLPDEISAPLGNIAYHGAVGCAYRGKYYVNMLDAADYPFLFVYDTTKGLWHKEKGLNTSQMVATDDNVVYTVPITVGQSTMNGIGKLFGTDEAPVRWYAETGILGLSSPDKKYISRLNLRLMLPVGSAVFISIEYDSSGAWEMVTNLTGHSVMPFTMAIKPRRCDHFRLRIEGIGDMKLYSICKTIEMGSDR